MHITQENGVQYTELTLTLGPAQTSAEASAVRRDLLTQFWEAGALLCLAAE